MKIVIDTNVVASGVFFGGKPRKILELLFQHKIDAYVSPEILQEYKNGSDIIKRMLNQALFEKIYVSCSKEVPLEIEEQYNPPFNVIIEPFKEEIAKLNRSIRANSEAALAKIATAKNRILSGLRCGLAACSDTRNMESYSNSNFFICKSSSKELLVDLAAEETNTISEKGAVPPKGYNLPQDLHQTEY